MTARHPEDGGMPGSVGATAASGASSAASPVAPKDPDGSSPDPTTPLDAAQNPQAPGAGRSSSSRRRRRLRGPLLTVLAGGVIGIGGQLITLPYVVLRPGPAVDILAAPHTTGGAGGADGAATGADEGRARPVIDVQGARTYPTQGSLFFTTVAQYGGPGRRPSVWDVIRAGLEPSSRVLPEEQVFPPSLTPEQVKKGSAAAMTDSQQEATAVVMRELHRPVSEKAVVAQVLPDGAAKGLLSEGDVVTRVGDTEITRAAQIAEVVQKVDGSVPITVQRGKRALTVTVTPQTKDGRRMVGILVQPRFHTDVRVTFNAGDVGGPSAGTMFALALYDELTPGALTGGQRIAGTGTLDSVGTVGPIGGIQQKMVGARDAGAAFFLAPRKNCDEVVGHVPDGLTVTPVATFGEARHAVEEIAAGRGGALPSCPQG